MYFVAGIGGQIGGALAAWLLRRGLQVRSLVRDIAKNAAWADQGVDLRVGDLADPVALAAALDDMEAAFLMQPTPIGVTRGFPEARALIDGIVVGGLERSPSS